MSLKDASETGAKFSRLDNQLNMGCEGKKSCGKIRNYAKTLLLYNPRSMVSRLRKKSRLERNAHVPYKGTSSGRQTRGP